MRRTLAPLLNSRRLRELAGLLLLLLAAITLLSLMSYDSQDPSWFTSPASPGDTRNLTGRVGANVSEALLQVLGAAAFLVPVVLWAVGWTRLRGRSVAASYGKLLGHASLLFFLACLVQLLYGHIGYGGQTFDAGGAFGLRMAGALESVLNRVGAVLFALTLVLASIVLSTRFSFAWVAEGLSRGIPRLAGGAWERAQAFAQQRRKAAERRAVIRKHSRGDGPHAPADRPRPRPTDVATEETPVVAPMPRPTAPSTPPATAAAREAPRQKRLPLRTGGAGFSLPPLELLNEPEQQPSESERELLERARVITAKFREFAVEGNVVAIHPGPVVTTFEFKPEAGVKYSKMTSLVDDLCLALKAESVRIDRMLGRSTVGIEVPNRRQELIYPRDLLASDRFQSAKSKLTLCLGKNISGDVFAADLGLMPHLLIAGATGAGKSVGVNGMITSILYKATPADVRFIMIDTKMIELGVYDEIPHMLVPVVTEPKKASTALKWAVREMETRYRQLASVGVRNLDQFNELVEREPDRTLTDERTGESVPVRRLPYIVIVIDEMADLMMVSAADVEESIMRLAQMARAVGIHLILATQRPSVDVITGTIKANFPSRIAFRVSQRVDSRTIIDQMGAERLLGRGDMLFLPSGSSRLIRLHGGFITEPEIGRLTAFLKKQSKPVYDDSVLKEPESERADGEGGERDALFVDAVRLVLQEGMCSITLIQRRMRLGYARAARIVDTMEREGIVGPADGSKPREVLVGPEILDTLEE